MKFTELPLKGSLLKALQQMKFTELTPIQEKTFPHILAGKDLLATAETGSGKTSACAIPLLQKINPRSFDIQVLVMVPTRELALQYLQEISDLGRYMNISPFAVYGGVDVKMQKIKLQNQVHILIATPGRLIDLMYSGLVSLDKVRTVVLDEADEMLNQGFLEDIDFVFSCLVQEHQKLLFSATMPSEIKRIVNTLMKDPIKIELNQTQKAPQSLTHQFKESSYSTRLKILMNLLMQKASKQAIIFCNSRVSAEKLIEQIRHKLPSVEMIHGGLNQSQRNSIMSKFRSRKIRFLIATDLAGRGLDFKHVTHIVNYDFPRDPVTYTHRTGRAGRMGRVGTALTLVSKKDMPLAKKLITRNNLENSVWIRNQVPRKKNNRSAATAR